MNGDAAGPLLFDERQWLPAWALALIAGMPLFVLLPLALAGPEASRPELAIVTVLVVAVDLAVLLLLGNMRTRVDTQGVLVTFGLFGWIRFRFGKRELASAHARRYRPLGEFGGWGIRGFRSRRALNMRGDLGVEIRWHRAGVTGTVLVGSQRPSELEHALRLLAIPPPARESTDGEVLRGPRRRNT